MEIARLIAARLVKIVSLALLVVLVGLVMAILVLSQGWFGLKVQSKQFSLPSSLLWQNNCFKKIASPTALPQLVLEELPFVREFSSYEALTSTQSNEFILQAVLSPGWDRTRLEGEIKAILAQRYPQKQELILPDKTKAQELIYNPNQFFFQELPSKGLFLIKGEENGQKRTHFLFIIKGEVGIITNTPKMLFSVWLSQNLLGCE